MTQTTDTTPTYVLSKLQAELNEFMTGLAGAQKDVETYAARAEALQRRMSTIQVATTMLKGLPSTADDQKWLDQLTAWRVTLCDELLGLPERVRTGHDLGKQQNLTLSILAIDRGVGVVTGTVYALETLRLGDLLREAGYVGTPAVAGEAFPQLPWYGSIPEVERRIRQVTKSRAEAEAQLADALHGTQYDKSQDGPCVEVAT